MSVLGTGIAAGVAQTAHQAQRVARRNDKNRRDQRAAATREAIEALDAVLLPEAVDSVQGGQERIVDENAGESEKRVKTESALPEDQNRVQDVVTNARRHAHHEAAADAQSPSNSDDPLYRHLDVEA